MREGSADRIVETAELYDRDLPGGVEEARAEIETWVTELTGDAVSALTLKEAIHRARER